ncbi:hypothetical protein TNCV_3787981 [Trichonephila clavipes]|nr:hypothetical protein TNCV_3787981 [Trichonephila clavipes]
MAHIIRMPDDHVVQKILQFKVTGIRKRGCPRLRWEDSVELDIGIITEKSWRTKERKKVHYGGIFKGKHWPMKGCVARYDDDILIIK